jgi:transposase
VVRVEAGVSPRVAGGRAAGGEGSMISLPAGVRVLVATRPVDFRKGADGLAALVRETLRLDPFPGMVFVFRAKPADHVDESVRNKTE